MSPERFRAKGLLEEVHDHALERKPFDALRAPFGADLVARHAPDLLCVRLEKCQVELLAEAVDDEIFERALLALWQQRRAQITDAAANGADQAHIPECAGGQADGIVEEAAQKIDAALALADQHDQVFGLRIGRRGRRRDIALLALVAELAVSRLRRPQSGISSSHHASRGPTSKRSGGRRCPCGCPCSGQCARCRRFPGWPRSRWA